MKRSLVSPDLDAVLNSRAMSSDHLHLLRRPKPCLEKPFGRKPRCLAPFLAVALLISSVGFVVAGGENAMTVAALPGALPCEEAWSRRSAEILPDGRPAPGAVSRAIASLERALDAEPQRLDLRFRLMEALYFKAYFVTTDEEEKKDAYARSIELTREVFRMLSARVGVADLNALSVDEQVSRLKGIPEAPPAHFWAAINWGLWGMTHGYYASATEGVAGRIRDHARALILLDETYADAGGLRLLGRMHTVTPRIPFATWWINRETGIEMLRRAHTLSIRDPRNAFFLAEALLHYEPGSRTEAMRLLREAADRDPDPSRVTEDMETIRAARELLKVEEGTGSHG